MKKFAFGRKIGMTQIVDDNDKVIPVTMIKAEPAIVIRHKTVAHDGYDSIVVGIGSITDKKATKAHKGIFSKNNVSLKRHIKEFRLSTDTTTQTGDTISVDIFEVGEKISVRSRTIGRGFTGTIKRWNFRRGPMSHGSKSHRIPGSIGGGTYPGKVIKGKKMAGHYGNENVTILNLVIVKMDIENGIILIKGSIPGKTNNLVEIFN